MTDIPIKTTQTFGDVVQNPPTISEYTLKPPSRARVADVNIESFLRDDQDVNIDDLKPLTALAILNYFMAYLLRTSELNSDDDCDDKLAKVMDNVGPLSSDDEQEAPLSPRKRRNSSRNSSLLNNKDGLIAKSKSPNNQDEVLVNRFSLKNCPDLSLTEYLERINQYCGLSTAVYLTSALYIYKLAIESNVIKLHKLNVHRLVIAALRVSCKTLEDINHRQQFIAKIGGVNLKDLQFLEISLLFLLKFDCQSDSKVLSTLINDVKGLLSVD